MLSEHEQQVVLKYERARAAYEASLMGNSPAGRGYHTNGHVEFNAALLQHDAIRAQYFTAKADYEEVLRRKPDEVFEYARVQALTRQHYSEDAEQYYEDHYDEDGGDAFYGIAVKLSLAIALVGAIAIFLWPR